MRNEDAMLWNLICRGEKFEFKDPDKYLYASLSQPPIKIINKNNSEDELDFTVECPNCRKHVNYGKEIFMISGHIYCSNKNCREKLIKKLEEKKK